MKRPNINVVYEFSGEYTVLWTFPYKGIIVIYFGKHHNEECARYNLKRKLFGWCERSEKVFIQKKRELGRSFSLLYTEKTSSVRNLHYADSRRWVWERRQRAENDPLGPVLEFELSFSLGEVLEVLSRRCLCHFALQGYKGVVCNQGREWGVRLEVQRLVKGSF